MHEQEEGVVSLRMSTKSSVDSRVSLCTPRVLLALRFLIVSEYRNVQVNAVAALGNLSLEEANKVKIVQSGMVPPLIDVMKGGGFAELQEYACWAISSLAKAEENKTTIGILGALPPLIRMMWSSESERARKDAAKALYHLSLDESNRLKLVKLGFVGALVGMLKLGHMSYMTDRALLILSSIGSSTEGSLAMLDAGAVECLVEILRRGKFESESTKEICVNVIWVLSRDGGVRFQVAAKSVGVEEVVREMLADASVSERGKKTGMRLLKALRKGGEGIHWEMGSAVRLKK